MSETVLLAIIGILGGAGGLFTLVKAILDYRQNHHAVELDADERLVTRLERRLDTEEKARADIDRRLTEAERYINILTITLAQAGIEVPPRPHNGTH